jgi:hypothetical protein
MTGLSRCQHFIEILVSKPDWDTCGMAFRKLILDPLGQAHMRTRRALRGVSTRQAGAPKICCTAGFGSANRLQKSVEGGDTFRLAITGFYTAATNPNF